jgi:hypothetical protein
MEITAAVEKLLSERFAGKVRLSSAEEIRSSHRSRVSRYLVLEGPPGAPQSVIVKQAIAVGREVYDQDRPDGPAWRLFNEWAGLQFLTESCGDASPSPQFYAGDRDSGFLVLEDLGTCKRLDQVLLGDDPSSAEATLVAFAATLGRMHAHTLGKQAEYERIRSSAAAATGLPPCFVIWRRSLESSRLWELTKN